jgi:hypothetical protein
MFYRLSFFRKKIIALKFGLQHRRGMIHESLDFDPVNETFFLKWNAGIAGKVTV